MGSEWVILICYGTVYTCRDQCHCRVIQGAHKREMSPMPEPALKGQRQKRSSLQIELQMNEVQGPSPE